MDEKPTLTVRGDTYRVVWQQSQIAMELERMVESKDGLTAELVVAPIKADGSFGLYHGPVRFNLVSTQARASLSKALYGRDDKIDWAGAIEQMCFRVIERWREGDPLIDFREHTPKPGSRWVLKPFVEMDEPTLLFADGGAGKSLAALAMAVSIAKFHPLIGEPKIDPSPVIYLDWEADEDTHWRRLHAILAAGTDQAIPPIFYQRMVASLAESVSPIRRHIEKHKIKFMVVDSVGLACGDMEGTSGTQAMFRAARSLGLPWLAIDHVTKNGETIKDKSYGTVFKHNWVRNSWAIENAQDEGSSVLYWAFVHKKANNGRKLPRQGFRVDFDNRIDEHGDEQAVKITIYPQDVHDVPALLQNCSIVERILAELQDGAKLPDDIAEAMSTEAQKFTGKYIANRLTKIKKTTGKVVNLGPATGFKWGLAYQAPGGIAG